MNVENILITEAQQLEHHLRQAFYQNNPIAKSDENHIKLILANENQKEPFINYENHLASMLIFLLDSTSNDQKNNSMYEAVKILSKIYFLNFLLEDASNYSGSFFEKHHPSYTDENSFGCLIAYLFMSIEDDLFSKQDLLLKYSQHIDLSNKVILLAESLPILLNDLMEKSPSYCRHNNKNITITYTDMTRGSWRNNDFVHLLIYGKTLNRQPKAPLSESILQPLST